jgi:hypothetical protein
LLSQPIQAVVRRAIMGSRTGAVDLVGFVDLGRWKISSDSEEDRVFFLAHMCWGLGPRPVRGRNAKRPGDAYLGRATVTMTLRIAI